MFLKLKRWPKRPLNLTRTITPNAYKDQEAKDAKDGIREAGKEDTKLQMTGVITEVLGQDKFRVKLKRNNITIMAYLAGKLRRGKVRVIYGDLVTVEMSTYDLTRGRIVYRYLNKD